MHGLELTFSTLAKSRNQAAIDVLHTALLQEDRSTRRRALEALLYRSEPHCRHLVLAYWNRLQSEDIELIRQQKNWLEPAIRQGLRQSDPEVGTAITAARQLELLSAIPGIIAVAESIESEAACWVATDAVEAMTIPLGRDARLDRDRPTLRSPTLSRLAESVRQFAEHRNEALLDAFLSVTTWGDSELRHLLDPDSPAAGTLLARMASSDKRPVIELLTGFIRRRILPEGIAKILAERQDPPFRDALLQAIGAEPCPSVLRNLKRIGLPECCRGGESLLEELQPDGRAALVHVAAVTDADPIRAMHLTCGVIERGSAGCEQAAASALSHCEVPDGELWVRAAALVADGDPERIWRHENARLLERFIRLLDHSNPSIVRSVRRLLQPLYLDQVFSRFDALRPRSRRRLGRVVQMVDPAAVERLREKLRHPVLEQRLKAISAADALAVVDLLVDAFRPIVRADHHEARRRAAQVLADAEGEETLQILREMTAFPDSTVRDTAIDGLARREARIQATSPQVSP